MAIDAFLYFPGQSLVKGETLDSDMSEKNAFELTGFSFSASNEVDIGSYSSGGGAGKTNFEPFHLDKKTDTSSCGIFGMLCIGKHFDEAILELRRAGGSGSKSGATFMKFHFRMVLVKNMEWTGSEDEVTESVDFEYGAIKIEYFKQQTDGSLKKMSGGMGETKWSRTLNKADYAVT